MAYATNYHLSDAQLGNADGWLAQLRQRAANYALYRKTLRELGELSQRELNDLGVARSSIRQIARESVYGA